MNRLLASHLGQEGLYLVACGGGPLHAAPSFSLWTQWPILDFNWIFISHLLHPGGTGKVHCGTWTLCGGTCGRLDARESESAMDFKGIFTLQQKVTIPPLYQLFHLECNGYYKAFVVVNYVYISFRLQKKHTILFYKVPVILPLAFTMAAAVMICL